MLCPEAFSSRYRVRRLTQEDLPQIHALCLGNELFYRYRQEPLPTADRVREDLTALPPGIPMSAKHYVGYFEDGRLAAVLDLIAGYPEAEIAFIGFFMMDSRLQGRGLGTAIITELLAYLQSAGFRAVRLGINKGNPQSTRFWQKNGFVILREVQRETGTVLYAERLFVSSAQQAR